MNENKKSLYMNRGRPNSSLLVKNSGISRIGYLKTVVSLNLSNASMATDAFNKTEPYASFFVFISPTRDLTLSYNASTNIMSDIQFRIPIILKVIKNLKVDSAALPDTCLPLLLKSAILNLQRFFQKLSRTVHFWYFS